MQLSCGTGGSDRMLLSFSVLPTRDWHSQGHHPRIFEPNWIHWKMSNNFQSSLPQEVQKAAVSFQLQFVVVLTRNHTCSYLWMYLSYYVLPALDGTVSHSLICTYLSSHRIGHDYFYLHHFRHWPATCVDHNGLSSFIHSFIHPCIVPHLWLGMRSCWLNALS